MAVNSRIVDLVLQWEELREQGQDIDPAQLCKDCPDLIEEVKKRMAALEQMRWMQPGRAADVERPRADTSRSDGQASTTSPPLPSERLGYELRAGDNPLPGYTLVRPLGRGGFGEVWEAIAPGDFRVALKFVRLAGKVDAVERRALELVRHLRHAHLLPIFGAWERDTWLIVAMELADRTLDHRLQEAKAEGHAGIPGIELSGYMMEVAEALDYLHEPRQLGDGSQMAPLQHRDVKPHNILLLGRHAKVSDYGLMRILEQNVVSHSGMFTQAYAAPEFLDQKTSIHSDQYSLAVAYCQLRGGQLPFTGTPAQIITGHLHRPPDLTTLPEYGARL